MTDPHETDVTFDDWAGLFPARIETDRLVLRRLSRETIDLLDFYDVCAHDPGIDAVTEYLTWDPHDTPEVTREFVTAMEAAWDDGEVATYVLYAEETDTLAGGAGLTLDWERSTGTLGVWLRKRFWGRGFSGERATALLGLAFDRLDLDLVAIEHLANNDKSRRAIEKYVEYFGGQRDGRRRNGALMDGQPNDVYRYSIAREEYDAARKD